MNSSLISHENADKNLFKKLIKESKYEFDYEVREIFLKDDQLGNPLVYTLNQNVDASLREPNKSHSKTSSYNNS
jgi:hypothetical protein